MTDQQTGTASPGKPNGRAAKVAFAVPEATLMEIQALTQSLQEQGLAIGNPIITDKDQVEPEKLEGLSWLIMGVGHDHDCEMAVLKAAREARVQKIAFIVLDPQWRPMDTRYNGVELVVFRTPLQHGRLGVKLNPGMTMMAEDISVETSAIVRAVASRA